MTFDSNDYILIGVSSKSIVSQKTQPQTTFKSNFRIQLKLTWVWKWNTRLPPSLTKASRKLTEREDGNINGTRKKRKREKRDFQQLIFFSSYFYSPLLNTATFNTAWISFSPFFPASLFIFLSSLAFGIGFYFYFCFRSVFFLLRVRELKKIETKNVATT